MDKMNDRRKAFENKFAHDSEMTFKAEARRNRMLAEWLGDKFGMSDEEAKAYGGTLIAADLKESGDDDVVQKVLADASERGVTVDEDELRAKSEALLGEAKAELMKDIEE
jgi:hypothetical protein